MRYRAQKLPYRLLSLLLAMLWGAVILLGAAGMARCRPASTEAARSASAASRCPMCRSLHRGGMSRCCCHKTPASASGAALCACCDPGRPHTVAALLGWSPAVPLGSANFVLSSPRTETLCVFSETAETLPHPPLARPPRLL